MTPAHSPSRKLPGWLVPAGIVAVALFAIALIILFQGPESTPAASPPTAPSATQSPSADTPDSALPNSNQDADSVPPTTVDRGETPDLSAAELRDPQDPVAVGPADAPVVLIVFSDYQCPFCAKWNQDTLPAMEAYVADGDLRIEFREVNVFGDASVRGARAAYAAGLQGQFDAMHGALFADGMHRATTQLTDDALRSLAHDVGLDAQRFAADYESDETVEAVARNQQLGIDLGAFSTPSFILAGQPIVGAQPTEVFVDLVDAALAHSPTAH